MWSSSEDSFLFFFLNNLTPFPIPSYYSHQVTTVLCLHTSRDKELSLSLVCPFHFGSNELFLASWYYLIPHQTQLRSIMATWMFTYSYYLLMCCGIIFRAKHSADTNSVSLKYHFLFQFMRRSEPKWHTAILKQFNHSVEDIGRYTHNEAPGGEMTRKDQNVLGPRGGAPTRCEEAWEDVLEEVTSETRSEWVIQDGLWREG